MLTYQAEHVASFTEPYDAALDSYHSPVAATRGRTTHAERKGLPMIDSGSAAVLTKHRGHERGVCDDGELWCGECKRAIPETDIAAHQIDALRRGGFAVVALPQPDEEDGDGQVFFDDWSVRADPTGRASARRVVTDFGLGTAFRTSLSPIRARRLAAALLAAADTAEDGGRTTSNFIHEHDDFPHCDGCGLGAVEKRGDAWFCSGCLADIAAGRF